MNLTMYGLINGLRSSVAVAAHDMPVLGEPGDRHREATLRDGPIAFNLSGDMIFYTVCYTNVVA